MSPAIRVVVADDQELVRAGFRLLLERVPDIEVVGKAGDGQQAVRMAVSFRADVVLMDVQMPRLDGLAATQQLLAASPGTKVVMLTTFDLDEYVFGALRAGACGFLLKSSPPEELIRGIRAAATGDGLLDPAVTRRVISKFAEVAPTASAEPTELRRLTDREREVLTQVSRGLSNAEIATTLVISEATVKSHVARLLAKLGLRDRVQAVVYAYEHGLTRPG
jgi:DNA-binding NarL/FixJ family response regulator